MYVDSSTGAYVHDQLMLWGPKVIIALLILVATWLVARAVKWALQKAIDKAPTLKRHYTGPPGETVGHQLGTIAKLIVWLVGIMAALQFLGIGQILEPIARLTNEIFAFLPKLLGAGLIFFVGLIVARIARKLVETTLQLINVDGLMARAGIGDTAGTVRADPAAVPPGTTPGATRATLARAAGILVFALIIIPVAIAALQVLGIEAISGPAINMLNQILAAIPRVLNMIPLATLAAILFVVGFKLAKPALFAQMYRHGWEQFVPFIATVVGILATDLLRGIGIGMVVGVAIVLHHNLRNPFTVAQHAPETEDYRIKLAEEVSFLNKGRILQQLAVIPDRSRVVIDATQSKVIDFDVREILREFRTTAPLRGIAVEFHGIILEPSTP